ncbi:MAG: hypothetical protein PUE80_03015 [bacterium]|nr:hypothetical protein [bacterium]
MKHLKHPKHLKHLKHSLWMFGLLFCKHFKELGGKVNDGVHGRAIPIGNVPFFGVGWWGLMGIGGLVGFGWMEENKKSGGGDVRAFALAWDGEWNKA